MVLEVDGRVIKTVKMSKRYTTYTTPGTYTDAPYQRMSTTKVLAAMRSQAYAIKGFCLKAQPNVTEVEKVLEIL